MNRKLRLGLMVLCGLAALFGGCSRTDTAQSPSSTSAAVSSTSTSNRCFTGVYLSVSDMVTQCDAALVVPPYMQATEYAQVSYAWLMKAESPFQSELFSKGVIVSLPSGQSGWTVTFNCVQFSKAFEVYAAETYNRDAFTATNPPPFLSIITISYRRDSDVAAAKAANGKVEGHQIMLILTDHGPVFWDAQVGAVKLSHSELASIYRSEA